MAGAFGGEDPRSCRGDRGPRPGALLAPAAEGAVRL